MDMAILRVGSKALVSRGREDVTAVLVISWQPDRQGKGKAGREKPGQAWVRR